MTLSLYQITIFRSRGPAAHFHEEAEVAPVLVHQVQLQTIVPIAPEDPVAIAVVEQFLDRFEVFVQQARQAVAIAGRDDHEILVR